MITVGAIRDGTPLAGRALMTAMVNRSGVPTVALGMPAATADPTGRAGADWPYRAGVVSSVRPAALRWVLLSVLAFAVIGMHSLIADDPAAGSMELARAPADAMSTEYGASAGPLCCPDDHNPAEHPGHSSGHSHDLQHLCLAVLVAAFVLMMGWLLWRSSHAVLKHREPSPSVTCAGRSPPAPLRTGDLLTSLCVLRL